MTSLNRSITRNGALCSASADEVRSVYRPSKSRGAKGIACPACGRNCGTVEPSSRHPGKSYLACWYGCSGDDVQAAARSLGLDSSHGDWRAPTRPDPTMAKAARAADKRTARWKAEAIRLAWSSARQVSPGTPAHAYLLYRRLVSEGEPADDRLLRWLPKPLPKLSLQGVPDAAVGLLLAKFIPLRSHLDSPPQCLEFECIRAPKTTAGSATAEDLREKFTDEASKKKSLGKGKGAVFKAPSSVDRIHVAEGYADALALSRRSGQAAVAVRGIGGWRNTQRALAFRGKRVWVWADPDEKPEARERAEEFAGMAHAERFLICQKDPAGEHRLGWHSFGQDDSTPTSQLKRRQ